LYGQDIFAAVYIVLLKAFIDLVIGTGFSR